MVFPIGGSKRSPIFLYCRPVFTWFIILTLVILFLVGLVVETRSNVGLPLLLGFIPIEWKYLINLKDIINVLSTRLPFWITPLSYVWIDNNAFSLIIDIFFIYLLGREIECRLGTMRFLIIIVFSSLMGAFFHYYFLKYTTADTNFDYTSISALLHNYMGMPLVGASPIALGFLGAYSRLFPGKRIEILTPVSLQYEVRVRANYLLLFYIVFFMMMAEFDKTILISWTADLGGLVGGYIGAILIGQSSYYSSKRRKKIRV